MPLNSYEFMLIFLPITFVGYTVLQTRLSRRIALSWLLLASVTFYLPSGMLGFALVGFSILWDFVAARLFLAMPAVRAKARTLVIYAAIVADVLFLCYFKYINVLLETKVPTLFPHLLSTSAYLPLGLSFLTFQKIGFLTDLRSGLIKDVQLFDFMLFGLFFPKAIAGPITRYNEFTVQIRNPELTVRYTDTTVGVCMLAIGLFKETVMASIAGQFVPDVFEPAYPLEPVDLLSAWFGALAYTFQLYFEFSGYSDMALGSARLFGIKLPMNFNSPFKAHNLAEFWGRWHITLTRFLTWQIYIPMVRHITKWRAATGRSVLRGMSSRMPAIVFLIGVPTLVTMTISGVWHGSGWTYILWGFIHGVCLAICQGWRLLRGRFFSDDVAYKRVMGSLGHVLTFLVVVGALVVFRADSVHSAVGILKGMLGLNGLTPEYLQILMKHDPQANWLFIMFNSSWYPALCLGSMMWILMRAPNSLDLLRSLHPALDFLQDGGDAQVTRSGVAPEGSESNASIGGGLVIARGSGPPLTLFVAVLYAAFLVLGISAIERSGKFIYGQF